MRRWYVVHTQPSAEQTALRNLVRQGFEVYCPRYLKRRSHARRIETVPAPLFPRYLFVAFDAASAAWRSIRSSVGVSQLVCWGDSPAPVPDRVIDSIRQREDGAGFVLLGHQAEFRHGDPVRVTDGVFADQLGLFEGTTDGDRVRLLLTMLGRRLRVEVSAGAVAPA